MSKHEAVGAPPADGDDLAPRLLGSRGWTLLRRAGRRSQLASVGGTRVRGSDPRYYARQHPGLRFACQGLRELAEAARYGQPPGRLLAPAPGLVSGSCVAVSLFRPLENSRSPKLRPWLRCSKNRLMLFVTAFHVRRCAGGSHVSLAGHIIDPRSTDHVAGPLAMISCAERGGHAFAGPLVSPDAEAAAVIGNGYNEFAQPPTSVTRMHVNPFR